MSIPSALAEEWVYPDDWRIVGIDYSGNLTTYGRNSYGQLGNGTTIDNFVEFQSIMDNVSTVVTGLHTTFAIRTDGSLWAFGRNDYGQLGDGTTTNRHLPVKIMDDVAIVSAGISAVSGIYQTFAITADGSLWAWGRNDYGQLGDGTTIDRHSPIRIMEGLDTDGWHRRIIPALHHTFAIREDGTLWAWGRNDYGQLGDGTTVNRHLPVKIMDNVDAIYADVKTAHAYQKDGSYWCWGREVTGRYDDDGMPLGSIYPVRGFRGITLYLNGYLMTPELPPRFENGRVMVPIRLISEEFGATVSWDFETKTATIRKDDVIIIIRIDDASPTINGRVVSLDQPTVLIGGARLFVPLRFIAEAFGATVDWNSSEWIVTITD